MSNYLLYQVIYAHANHSQFSKFAKTPMKLREKEDKKYLQTNIKTYEIPKFIIQMTLFIIQLLKKIV